MNFLKSRASRRAIGTTFVALVAAGFIVGSDRGRDVTPIRLAGDALGELPAQIAKLEPVDEPGPKEMRHGRHVGFDTYAYPGDAAMRAWRADNTPYEWVGYYLPAPCHKGRTWMGKRERLASMGWGTAVIYVGQQTWDRTPRTYETSYRKVMRTKYVNRYVKQKVRRSGKLVTRTVKKRVPVRRRVSVPVRTAVHPTKRPLDECNTNLVSGPRGAMEADDAIRRTEAEGFPRGSVIFLDIERMQSTPQAMRDYYRAWTRRVLEDGRYVPGFYAHMHNAQRVYGDVKAVFVAEGRSAEPPFWIAGGRGFHSDRRPEEIGHSFTAVWQGVLDTWQEWNGYRLPIDVNVAAVPDPSSARYVSGD
jgi:hypothetical protein